MTLRNYVFSLILLFGTKVNAEGYYCPYSELGSFGENVLLYDYYTGFDNVYWTRTGQTGWESVYTYCDNKGNIALNSDAGEAKCEDSHDVCKWDSTNSKCIFNQARQPDCKNLCQAVLDGLGPSCLGNCPSGKQSNYLYTQYTCEDTSSSSSTSSIASSTPTTTKNKCYTS